MTVDYRVGDTREVIKGIADGSVDLIASSPPFLALRSYVPADHESKGDEIGSEANPAEFIDMLLGLTAEWGRVLAAHGSLAIELGDTYSGSGGGGGDYLPGGLRYGQVGFDGSAAREHNAANWRQKNPPKHDMPDEKYGAGRDWEHERGKRAGKRDKPYPFWPNAKSLALIPQLYAVALAYDINPLTGAPSPAGRWLVRNVIVWHRPNPAVGALGDKVRPSTSYIVIATRSPKRWFDLTAVRTAPQDQSPRNTNGPQSLAQSHESASFDVRLNSNPAGAPPLDAWFDHYDGSHDTWTLTTQPSKLCHYAMWPAKLAERLVLSMCPLAVCRVCGEPRRRMEVTTNAIGEAAGRRSWRADPDGIGAGHVGAITRSISSAPTAERETTGWTECCDWLEGPTFERHYRPGLVLDPFAGSGTTLAVADLHGRDAIGIDFDTRNKAIYPARYDEVKRALYGTPIPKPNQLALFGGAP